MATTTDDELDLEEQKRKQQQASVGKPIGPQQAPAQAAMSQPIGKPIAPPAQPIPAMAPPEVPSAPSPTAPTSLAPPATGGINLDNSIAAPRPAADRVAGLAAQGPPQYHGLKRVADAIGGATNIGTAIERGAGIGTQGYEANLERASGAADVENKQVENAQKEQSTNATTSKAQAEAGEATQRGNAAEAASKNVIVTSRDGRTLSIPEKDVAKYESTMDTNSTKSDIAGNSNTTALRKLGLDENGQPIPEEKLAPGEQQQIGLNKARTDLADAEANFNKFKSDPNSPMYRMAQQRMALAQQGYDLRLKEFGFNYEPSILSSSERDTLPTDVSGNPTALHSPLKPGASTVTAAYRAQNIVSQIPRLTQEIQTLANKLGPIQGRWERFWQGDVGVADPEFAHISDDMDFASSAMALAHAQGRLPKSISDKFDRMYEAGKQDPKNMIAAWQVAAEWLPKIVGAAQTAGERNNPAGGAGGAGANASPPTGSKFSEWAGKNAPR